MRALPEEQACVQAKIEREDQPERDVELQSGGTRVRFEMAGPAAFTSLARASLAGLVKVGALHFLCTIIPLGSILGRKGAALSSPSP